MDSQITRTDGAAQNIYVGIDTHLKQWTVSILLDSTTFKKMSIDPSAKALAAYLKKTFPGCRYYSAYEASFCGFKPHRELLSEGIVNIVVNPADIPTTDKERQQKDDKRDSMKIARSLRSDELTGIYVPSVAGTEFRSLVRHRKTIVKEIARNKNRVKSYLYFLGIEIPRSLNSASKYWSGNFSKWLSSLEFTSAEGKHVMDSKLGHIAHLRAALLDTNRKLRECVKDGNYSENLRLLIGIPGIGLIAAATLLSEVEDFDRFRNIDRFCSYIGLVPSTHSSGEREIHGRVTKRANNMLRAVLIESSWVAVRHDPVLALRFDELCKRMEKNKAIIRIAKKILGRIRYVIHNKTEYVIGVA